MAAVAGESHRSHRVGQTSDTGCSHESLQAANTALPSQPVEGIKLKTIEKGIVYFIGAGPGDPELITVRGANVIKAADLIVYAGSLVPKTLLAQAKEGAKIHDSSSLSLEETHALLAEGVEKDLIVARVHTGDPALYGAIQEQIQLLQKEGIPCDVVPGVTAAFAAAAALGRQFTQPVVARP